MQLLEYHASTGEVVNLSGASGLYAETALELRSHKWSYELAARSLTGSQLQAREFPLDLKVTDLSAYDRLRALADSDMRTGQPGMLVADGWQCSAYLTASSHQSLIPGLLSTSLTVAQLSAWWRDTSRQYVWGQSHDASWLDYPYDYAADYAGMAITGSVTVTARTGVRVCLRIFGPVANPYILIGGNRYQANVSVPAGSRLEIDGRGGVKTARIIRDDGTVTNAFASLARGSGMYPFAPITYGSHSVVWQAFDWELIMREERSEPLWT